MEDAWKRTPKGTQSAIRKKGGSQQLGKGERQDIEERVQRAARRNSVAKSAEKELGWVVWEGLSKEKGSRRAREVGEE